MASLQQDGELLYHVDKEVCVVDGSPLLEPLSPPQSIYPLKIVHIRLHKLLQSVAEVCYDISQQWGTDQEQTLGVLVDWAWLFFLYSSSSCKLTACVDKVLECVTSLYWWSVAIENTRTQQPLLTLCFYQMFLVVTDSELKQIGYKCSHWDTYEFS